MKVALIYLYICNPEVSKGSKTKQQYEDAARKFTDTYRRFPAGYDHDLHVVLCNGEKDQTVDQIFQGLNVIYHRYDGKGKDIGAHQHVADTVQCDFMVCMSSMVYFRKSGWLARLMVAREKIGEGIYGTAGTYQHPPGKPDERPNPHLRTYFYGLSPELFKAYNKRIESRADTFDFESGKDSISRLAARLRMAVIMVLWSGNYTVNDWRKPRDGFRNGNQSDLLAFDYITDLYDNSDKECKIIYKQFADGIAFSESKI